MKRIFIASLGLLLLNSGCVYWAMSKVTDPSKPKSDIRLVSKDSFVENCKKLGPVKASSGWGGVAMQSTGRKEVRKKLLNKTDQLGGNVLRINNISSGLSGAKGDGVAFRCSPEWIEKIPARETMYE
jgi:hypothetical protein